MSSNDLIAELNSPNNNITFDWKESPYIFVGTLKDFEDDQTTAAINMSYLGEKCLNFIEGNHSFGKKYRIELCPNKSEWKLYLHIDSVAWFDALINECKKNCAHFYRTPQIYCGRHRPNHPCNWYVENERIVPFDGRAFYNEYKIGDDEWILTSRQKNIREILVFPLKHKTNKELVKSKSFWLWVFDDVVNKFFNKFQSNEYPVECFAINFGEWESEESVDRYAINCHGYLHLQLKIELVKKMEEKIPAMRGKVDDPTHYGLKDCQELEISRLLSMENSRVKKEISQISRKLDLIMTHLGIPKLD